MVSSLHCDQLWFSVLVSACCRKKTLVSVLELYLPVGLTVRDRVSLAVLRYCVLL